MPDRQNFLELHRSTNPTTGAAIAVGKVPTTDGAGGFTYEASSIPTGTYELAIEGGQDVIQAHGTLGSTEACDPTDGNIHTGTLDANCTITMSAPSGSGGATLEWWLTEDGTGGWSPTFAATGGTFTWDGTTPTFTTTAGTTFRVVLERIPGTTNDWVGDLVGGAGVTYATPAIVLGTAAAAGAAASVIRSDSTIVAFDATVPTTQAFGDAAATGSVAKAARRDHLHGMPASGGVGEILISDTPSTPLVFADLLQNEAQTDLLYSG